MNLVRRSLIYFWRTNLAVIVGVATAAAVLSGALLVGDSVRASLRDLVLARLGKTQAVVTSAQFFREQLAAEMLGAVPLIVMQGVVTSAKDGRRASKVAVYGVDDRFFQFNGYPQQAPTGNEARLTAALARELGVQTNETVLLRIEKPSAIPRESLQGRKEDSGRTLRLTAANDAPEFALQPSQGEVSAIYVSLRRLQRDFAQPSRVNTLLLQSSQFPKDSVTLDDLGIKIRTLPTGLSVETSSAVMSDALVATVQQAASGKAEPIFSYVANSISIGEHEVPYSIVTGMGSDLPPDGIALDDWAAKDLNAKPGDTLILGYYYWEPSGSLITRNANFKLIKILPMSGIAIDQDLTPEYPGITEAQTIGDWDPPFPVDLKKVRPRDEDYWKKYRTAPKAFVAIETAQKLWGSRFGKVTSMRVSDSDPAAFSQKLRALIDPQVLGMAIVEPRAQALKQADGSTDFGEYFTYFSFFLVVSALLLTGLFFQLGIGQRLREIGTLRAVGFPASKIRRLFLAEGLLLSIVGVIAGSLGAIVYAAFLLYGLKTWWRGAVGTGLLKLHVSVDSLLGGAVAGVLIALLCVLATLRSLKRSSPRDLLSGNPAAEENPKHGTLWLRIVAAASIISAMALVGASLAHSIPDAGAFFGAGTLLLTGAIFFEWARLRGQIGTVTTVVKLGVRNASHRPGRSVLVIALIASAVFLVVALDAFRRPPVAASDPHSGTGGFPLAAESQLPIFWDPNTPAGRENLNLQSVNDAKFYAFRLRPGEDASCLNLYEPRTPRILGAPRRFLDLNRFSFTESISKADNPWRLLDADPQDGAIPAIADANSITYVLHHKIGDIFDAGGIKVKLVAALDDSIFQSELIISEKNFTRAFPDVQGFRYFLIDGPPSNEAPLEDALSDYGFDVVSTHARLASFHRVENTYLSTFQALGGLGLLLGTLGLGAVLLRNVMERRKELALLRAVGYRPEHLRTMVIAENAYLLIAGTLIGAVSALVAILPAFLQRGGHFPNPSLALLLLAVPVAGIAASLIAVRMVARAPLLGTLRAE
ncbi:MAG TPA: FtsX-like permease family protein [Bryobacteraceae bacterium]|jgi:putative ABC transport system permease protein|nr:FtsX-like permease family protein [Bryobacteraceae bacterium]